MDSYQIEARFGRYGALPIIVAYYKHQQETGFVLVDGVNGNIDGPYLAGSTINPLNLLNAHAGSYISGTSVVVVRADTGCKHPVADEDLPIAPQPADGTVPGHLTPMPGRPARPATPTTPAIPAGPAGRPSQWICTDNVTTCVCVSVYNYDLAPGAKCPYTPNNGGCKTRMIVTCTTTGGGGIAGGACRSVPNDKPAPTPPATAPSPAPAQTTCVEEWRYWGTR